MLVTRAADYGLQGMMHLAGLSDGKEAYVAEIARQCQVPSSFLAKIFQSLSKAGLVKSHRGAKGGFCLAKPPEDITILDVIQAVEGPVLLNKCFIAGTDCKNYPDCPVHEVLEEATTKLVSILGRYNLRDLKEWRANHPSKPEN